MMKEEKSRNVDLKDDVKVAPSGNSAPKEPAAQPA